MPVARRFAKPQKRAPDYRMGRLAGSGGKAMEASRIPV
jgi:hypothetical protein